MLVDSGPKHTPFSVLRNGRCIEGAATSESEDFTAHIRGGIMESQSVTYATCNIRLAAQSSMRPFRVIDPGVRAGHKDEEFLILVA